MKKLILQNLWWVTFVVSIVLLVAHSLDIGKLKVDSTSILLLVIILISPFASSLRKIKFGEFEAEIDPKEVEKIKSEVEEVLESKPEDQEARPEIYKSADSIRELAEEDSIIALAKLRIELEKSLKRLEEISGIETKRPSLGAIVRNLASHEIISPQMGKSLSEVISICNRAIHGESISDESAETIIDLGVNLLEDLYWDTKLFNVTGTITGEEIITPEECEAYYLSKKYRVTSVTPLVDNPKRTVRVLTQDQLDDMLENYEEYAEFLVEIVEIPDDG